MGSNVQRSKLLSLVLRHEPERASLRLDEGGWVDVDALLKGLAAMGAPMTHAELEEVVATSDKKRFTLSDDGTRIRAAQGHSVQVEMNYSPKAPPDLLFHGTASRFAEAIAREGLKPMSRQHVHLSLDVDTAIKVGQRHGKPVIFTVESGAMHADGHAFYCADNGVWLTESVPPEFLRMKDASGHD